MLGSDDSFPLDSKILPCFPALCEVLAEGPQEERIFDFSYQDLVREFGRSWRRLRIKRLVPYQKAQRRQHRLVPQPSLEMREVQSRGRWGSEKSMLRYNKSAKLAQAMKQFDRQQLDFFGIAESRLEALFFGQARAAELPLP